MRTARRRVTTRQHSSAGEQLVALVLTVLALAAVPSVVAASPAAAAEPCVGVIVDARLLGGGVSTGCANGDPDSGLRALTMAGFSYAFVPRQPGLVCQVNGTPECSRTSTDTYWSYWYRAKGSSTWVYSSRGAGYRDPEPGSTEAWVWQEGGRRQPPDIALRRICLQVAQAAPTKSSSPSPDRTRSETRSASPRESTAESVASASGRTSLKPSAHSSSPTASSTAPTPTTTSPAPEPSSIDPSPAAASSDDGSGDGMPWLGMVLGAALIAGLGGAALVRSRRGGGP